MKKRWKMIKRNNTTKQGKAYIGMYSPRPEQRTEIRETNSC